MKNLLKHYLNNSCLTIIIMLLGSCLINCSGSGSNTNPAPTITPTVTPSVTPTPTPTVTPSPTPTPQSVTVNLDSNSGGVANAESNAPLSPIIVLKFSLPMNVNSINSNNIVLSASPLYTNPITLTTFVASNDNTRFQFSPSSPLNPNTTYYIGITNATALNGTSTNGDFYFITGVSNSPDVSMLDPENNATNVWLTSTIELNFSKAVNGVNTTNVVLHTSSTSGPEVAATITQSASESLVYTITPVSALNYATTYYLTLSSSITDLNGNPLAPTTFQFTTARVPVLYVTNFNGNSVSKCLINQDSTLSCSDSGLGSIFNLPFDVKVSSDGTIAYVSNTAGDTLTNLGTVLACTINTDGTFSSCTDAGGLYNYSSPHGIAIDPNTNVAYVTDFNINAVTACVLEGNSFSFCYIDDITELSSPAGIDLETINDTAYAYIANYSESSIAKCVPGDNATFTTCSDSGGGANFPTALGVAVNPNLLVAYITIHGNAVVPSSLMGCKVNGSNGDFYDCVTVLDRTTLHAVSGDNPSLIIFNKYNNNIYFTGSLENTLVKCSIVNNDYTQLNCAPATTTPSAAFNYPSGITIQY
jgi:DNA-binding beta-propeller fold protein YncE